MRPVKCARAKGNFRLFDYHKDERTDGAVVASSDISYSDALDIKNLRLNAGFLIFTEERWFATRFCALKSPVKNLFCLKANVVLCVI